MQDLVSLAATKLPVPTTNRKKDTLLGKSIKIATFSHVVSRKEYAVLK